MIDWCNSNQGFLMVVLTFVYVVATIIICYFNYKAIHEQKEATKAQNQVALFSERYETYKLILDELHFWRFNSNIQVEYFFQLANTSDVSLCLATHCQGFFDILTRANLVFGEKVYARLDESWKIVREKIYPCIKDTINKSSDCKTAVDILIAIKYRMKEDDMAQYIQRLLVLEAEISSLVESDAKISDL